MTRPDAPEAPDHRTFAEGALTRLLLRVPASLLAQIDAHKSQLQQAYPWITVNRSDAARDLLMRAVQACAGTAAETSAPQWQPGTARPRLPVAVSGVRLQIMTLLRDHPNGLTPREVQEQLGCPKDLAPTIRSMARDGLLRRVAKGIYTAAAEESQPPAPR